MNALGIVTTAKMNTIILPDGDRHQLTYLPEGLELVIMETAIGPVIHIPLSLFTPHTTCGSCGGSRPTYFMDEELANFCGCGAPLRELHTICAACGWLDGPDVRDESEGWPVCLRCGADRAS